jgi:hypothetical protein
MDNNFTHILCVKLFNLKTNNLLISDFLLSAVKEIITSATQIESIPYNNTHDIEVLLNWKQVNWDDRRVHLIDGDLVTKCHYEDDKIIMEHTSKMLLGIETYLKVKYLQVNDDKWTIIFNIVKPVF